jgi:glyoxylase-like metal-dependent hydrolase (beta-lactamase superfamily II)
MDVRDFAHRMPHDGGFVEVADRCWVARYEYLDVNVGIVGGERGLLVVDTHASETAARMVVEQVRRLGAGEVVAVVNTHQHFDHCFGNVVFSEAYDGLAIHAHEAAVTGLAESGPALQAEAARDEQPDAQRSKEVAQTRIVLPDHTFSSARAVDLGDRFVELVHPGRGHTAGDAVVRVPDVDVLFAGDLVEESARGTSTTGGMPGFGDDCYPLEWPFTLDLMASMLSGGSVVVPGHGLPVDKDFVLEQRGSIGVVAETIRELAGSGVTLSDALTRTEWPYPVEELRHAVARGYAQLPPGGRALPLA